MEVSEDLFVSIALSLRHEINRGFAVLREIAAGRDLKKFLAVCELLLFYIFNAFLLGVVPLGSFC